MSRLIEYFNEVDKNAVLRAAHFADPSQSMQRFGLSADESEAALSGNEKQMAIAAGLGTDYEIKFRAPQIPQHFYFPSE